MEGRPANGPRIAGHGVEEGQAAFDQGRALGDLGVVPAGAVLILQENEVAGVIDAAGSASIHEEQQREKAADLGS